MGWKSATIYHGAVRVAGKTWEVVTVTCLAQSFLQNILAIFSTDHNICNSLIHKPLSKVAVIRELCKLLRIIGLANVAVELNSFSSPSL